MGSGELRCNATQHNTTQSNAMQHNAMQSNAKNATRIAIAMPRGKTKCKPTAATGPSACTGPFAKQREKVLCTHLKSSAPSPIRGCAPPGVSAPCRSALPLATEAAGKAWVILLLHRPPLHLPEQSEGEPGERRPANSAGLSQKLHHEILISSSR